MVDATPAPEVEVPGENRAVALDEQSRAAHFAGDGAFASKAQPERTPRQQLLRRTFSSESVPANHPPPASASVSASQVMPSCAPLQSSLYVVWKYQLTASSPPSTLAPSPRISAADTSCAASTPAPASTTVPSFSGPGQIRLAAREDEGHLVVARPVEQEYAAPARHRDGVECRDAPARS